MSASYSMLSTVTIYWMKVLHQSAIPLHTAMLGGIINPVRHCVVLFFKIYCSDNAIVSRQFLHNVTVYM